MIDEKELIEELRKYADELGTVRREIELANGVLKAISIIEKQPKVDEWIPCSGRLPEEHNSFYTDFIGTEYWKESMYEKESDIVIATIEYKNGKRKISPMRTIDGKWDFIGFNSKACKVVAWQPYPELYQGETE